MTYGLRTVNNSGIVSIDENSTSYVYLGKYNMNALQLGGDVYVHCVGYPLIFFGIPYNTANSQESQNNGYGALPLRSAVAMTRLRQAPGDPNTWIVSMSCNFVNGADPGPLYVRVFGLLHLNFPNGSGESWGARLRNQDGQLTFDTGCKQLRLAGNTYDTELVINSTCPTPQGGSHETLGSTDTVVGLPFDMANKSIMANTRSIIRMPYQSGGYVDWDTGQYIEQWDVYDIQTGFWASGNALYARKYAQNSMRWESSNGLSVVSQGSDVYTRVATIDNNLYP